MSAPRTGGILQPAWLRAASVFADTANTVGARLQTTVRQVIAAAEEAKNLLVALVTPASVVVMVFGLWRLTADVGWTESFPISTGLFSHWQVWIALAIGLKAGAWALTVKSESADEKTEEN